MTMKKRYWPLKRKFGNKNFTLISVNKNKIQAKKRANRSNIRGAQHRVVSGKTVRYNPRKGKIGASAKKGRGAVYGRIKEGY